MGKTKYRKLKTNKSDINYEGGGISKYKNQNQKQNYNIARSNKYRKLTQKGGFLSWLKLKWNLYKFRKLIGKFNKLEVNMQEEIDANKAGADYFEKYANEYAKIATNYIINTRQLTIMEIFQNDKKELISSDPLTSKKVERNLANIKSNDTGIRKQLNSQIAIISSEIPEFNRLKNAYEKQADKFKSYIKSFSELKDYQQTLKSWQIKYNSLITFDQSKLSYEKKNFLKTYESRKADYENIINLSDDVIQKYMELNNEINNLLIKTQYFKSQFGTFKSEDRKLRTRQKGDIDMAIDLADKNLMEWTKKFRAFSKKLFTIDDGCDKSIENLKKIEEYSRICLSNLQTIVKTKQDNRSDTDIQKQNIDAMMRFNHDLNDLIKGFNLASAHIKELKREFYKQTPAVRIGLDFIPLVTSFNYLELRLDLYKKIFNNIQTKQNGGAFRPPGPPYYRPPGGPPRVAQPRSDWCNILAGHISYDRIYNETIYNICKNIEGFKKDFVDDHKNACYQDCNKAKQLIKNFYDYYLFCLNMYTDITQNNPNIPDPLQQSIRIILNMLETVEDCSNNKKYTINDLITYFKDGFNRVVLPDFSRSGINISTPPYNTIHFSVIFDVTNAGIYGPQQTQFPHLVYLMREKIANSFNGSILEYDKLNKPGNISDKLQDFIDSQIKSPKFQDYYPPNQPIPTQISSSGLVSLNSSNYINKLLTETNNILTTLNNNPILLNNFEYTGFIDQLIPLFDEQKNMDMVLKGTDKIVIDVNNLLDEIKNNITNNTGLTNTLKNQILIIINTYNNYWQSVKSIYNTLKTNGLDDTTAKTSALKYWDYIEKLGDAIKAKTKLLDDSSPSSSTLLSSNIPPALNGAINIGGTPLQNVTGNVLGSSPGVPLGSKPITVDSQMDLKDVNLLQNILIHIPTSNALQYENVLREINKIKDILNNVINSDGFVKKLANDLQEMTQLLFEIKYIEPQLIDIKVKEDKSINLDLSWIMKPLESELKDAHKLATSNQLEEFITKNNTMFKIYQKKVIKSDNVLKDVFDKLQSYFYNLPELNNRIKLLYQNSEYTNIFNDINNVTNFLNIVRNVIEPTKDNIPKLCNILKGIEEAVSYSPTKGNDIKDLLQKKREEWDTEKCKPKQPQPGTPKPPHQQRPGGPYPTPPRYGQQQYPPI